MKKKKVEGYRLEGYKLEEYPEVKRVEFPSEIYIAFAVCGRICGNKEFIVDGSSQICEHCGKQMYRTKVRKYKIDR